MLLSVQNIFTVFFIAVMAFPLPLLLVYYPIHKVYLLAIKRLYYNIVKKHYANPHKVSEEQLYAIFPYKKPEQIQKIAEILQD